MRVAQAPLRRLVLWLIVPALALAGGGAALRAAAPAVTQPAATQPFAENGLTWTPLFRGVVYTHQKATEPRLMSIHIARVDAKAPGVKFLVSPPLKDKPGFAPSLKPSTFLTRYKLQLAVNASPFTPDAQQEDQPRKIRGLSMSNGNLYQPHDTQYGALVITKDNRIRIGLPPLDLTDAWNGVGGYSLPLKDGKDNTAKAREVHPRTAVGVSRDGRYLYLLVIDGRQPRASIGATLQDIAVWMQKAGAWTALNLDGGASATMVIAGPDGKPKVLNKPMHRGNPGMERPSGNHVGVFAEGL